MTIACASFTNFRFEGCSYRIINAGTNDESGEPYATIQPHDKAFHDELLKHIKSGNKFGPCIVSGTGVYPECFQCFAGREEHEQQLLLKQRKDRNDRKNPTIKP
jgi:hypothetical protein